MVKQKGILAAVNQVLTEAYENYTIYIQGCPIDFDRPSFKIELVQISQAEVSRSIIKKTINYTITCFATTEDYFQSNPEELIDLLDTILQKFQVGHITVEDRALKILSSTGKFDSDRAYIDLQFEYYEERVDEEEQMPLVASISTRIKEE
ncbi:MAG: hypothetical protein K0S04_875 [Herbinix sp.]|nr:hypothetical protein [Herbinix sp.]